MNDTIARQHDETLTSLRDHHASAILAGDDAQVDQIEATYERLTGKLLLAVEQDDGSAVSIEV
jgi:hypothetical protein